MLLFIKKRIHLGLITLNFIYIYFVFGFWILYCSIKINKNYNNLVKLN